MRQNAPATSPPETGRSEVEPSFASGVTDRQEMTKSQSRTGLILALGGVLVVGAGVGWWLAGGSGPDAAESATPPASTATTTAREDRARPVPVAVETPQAARGFQLTRAFTGEVRARRRLALGFPVGGRIESLAADEGDAVTVGQPIATLDTRRLIAERKRLQGQQAELQAQLDEMREGPRVEVVAAARKQVEQLEARAALLAKQLTRRQELRESDRVTQEEVDEFETSLRVTRAGLAGARQRLLELENGTREETIRAQQARLGQVAAQLLRLKADIDDSTLEAPFAGRVLARHAEERSVVSPGVPVYTLSETGHPEAWLGLPPHDALSLAPESTHAIVVDGVSYPSTLHARVPDIDPQTRTQTVVFSLPAKAAKRVVAGQIARLELTRFEEAPGVWVRTDALGQGVRGLWAVYTVAPIDGDPDGAHRVVREHVEVLHTEGDRTLVRGTLDATRPVIVGETRKVVPGQRVLPSAVGR